MSLQTINIGRFHTGGRVGCHPTILIGTLFVENIGLLDTPATYRFEPEKVQEKIDCSSLVCKKAGVPVVIALSAKTKVAILKQIEFIVEKTDCSFLILGIEEELKLTGLELASSSNVLDRTLYELNSTDASDEEIQKLKENKPAAIMIKLEKRQIHSIDDALEQVDQIKKRLPTDLHSILLLWIDFAEGTSVKTSCEIGQELRSMTGHPIVGSPIEVISGLERLKLKGESSYFSALASTIGFCTAYGFDLLFVGPLQHLPHLSDAQGVVDIYNRSVLIKKSCADDLSECHPIHELM